MVLPVALASVTIITMEYLGEDFRTPVGVAKTMYRATAKPLRDKRCADTQKFQSSVTGSLFRTVGEEFFTAVLA